MKGDVTFIRNLAVQHRKKLLERVQKINDGAFSSGAAWSLHALDRIILACDGETDPVKLGLREKPRVAPKQETLFSVRGPDVDTTLCLRCQFRAPNYARGLCAVCHKAARREGCLDEYKRNDHFSRDDLLDEWEMLASEGYTRRQAAERLRMKPESFCRAIYRARRAGDPRAVLDRLEKERAAS